MAAMSGSPHPANQKSFPEHSAARKHHVAFKYALVQRALHRPAEFLALCNDGALKALWHELGAPLASEERCSANGLGVKLIGKAEAPVIMIMMPPPERANEAYYLCTVPAGSRVEGDNLVPPQGPEATACFRVFGMERSMLSDGSTIGFVVDWTTSRRRNYDAPSDSSAGAFWGAITQIVAGTRRPIHTTESSLAEADAKPTPAHAAATDAKPTPAHAAAADAKPTPAQAAAAAVAELDRSTWLASVGRPLTLGFPERFAKARLVTSWEGAFEMVSSPARSEASSAPLVAFRAAVGDDTYGPTITRLATTTQALLRRKFPKVLATAEENNAFSKFVQLDLIGLLLALEEPARVPVPLASDLLLLYCEGRLPCAWDAERITAIF